MWAIFDEQTRRKVEENPVIKKAIVRVFTLLFPLGVMLSFIFVGLFYKDFIFYKKIILPFISVIIFSVFFGGLLSAFVFYNILINLKKIVLELSNESPAWEILEQKYIESDIKGLYLAIKNLHQTVRKQAAFIGVAKMAAQVAHDIRSPLVALGSLEKEISLLKEEKRNLFRNAIARINDIANNLLFSYKEKTKENNVLLRSEPIFLMLDMVISEKRMEYLNCDINISLNISDNCYGACCNLSPVDFKRTISNIINNAVEACKENVSILVKVSMWKEKVKIEIIDNGCGMDNHLVKNIVNGGISIGKKSGLGLGVSYAVNCITQWGGSYNIFSEINKGTTFEILLPIVASPEWFLDRLLISKMSKIFVVDDDPTIHSIWSNRLNTLEEKAKIEINHFYKPEEFLLFYNAHFIDPSFCLYLIDYEFITSPMNGIDIIEKLKLQNASLVTGRYEEIEVRNQCEKLGVKILPKNLAAFIPIEINIPVGQGNSDDLIVFVDDNESITQVWQLQAAIAGKNLITFNKVADFLKSISEYALETVFYIDSELDGDYKGEAIAKILYERGHRNIYFSTGYEKNTFPPIPYVKEIIGKNPPF